MNRIKIFILLLSVLLISSALGCTEGQANKEPQRKIIRFTNPDGTIPISEDVVLDNLIGLMWLKDDNCIRTNYPSGQMDGLVSYGDALNFIAQLNKGKYPKCSSGYSDWRLPTKKELRSLLSSEDPSISAWVGRRTLANIQAYRYWVSGGWYYSHVHPYFKVGGCYVWPVRSDNSKSIEALKSDKK
jgi:hypothetical protein